MACWIAAVSSATPSPTAPPSVLTFTTPVSAGRLKSTAIAGAAMASRNKAAASGLITLGNSLKIFIWRTPGNLIGAKYAQHNVLPVFRLVTTS
jgi:hypothetical protein